MGRHLAQVVGVQDGNRKFLVLPYGKSAEVIPFQGKEWVHLKE
ncbi:DNA relaxase mbeA domain protein [Escherichia coli]|nr:DNA relaxase mbeA domain protein [Escherichia coli]